MGDVNGYEILQKFVSKYPTRKAAAAALHISAPYLTDLLNLRRDLSRRMLDKLGLKRSVVTK
jgi:plasmid maintenance system antidote protein VapI